jgi:hypothetical protein
MSQQQYEKEFQNMLNGTTPKKELTLWDKSKKIGSKAYRELFGNLEGNAQSIVDAVSPVDASFTEQPSLNDAIDDALSIDENDVGFKVYRKIGELAKLKEGFTDPSDEDIKQYNQNLKSLITEYFGYDALFWNPKDESYYVQKGNDVNKLDPTLMQSIVGEALGDKAEIYGAIAMAKVGSKVAGGAKAKIAGAIGMGALGAVGGSVLDTTASILSTGQELSLKQFGNELAKSAVLDAGGALVGGAVIKIGGKILKAPKDAYDLLLNGNIDGAKQILKSDLKLSDDAIDEALEQMQKGEMERYGEGAFKGYEKRQEELLASTLSTPQGERIAKEAVANNPKASFELEQSIDARAKGVLDNAHSVNGTKIKEAVEGYEGRVKKQFKDMRDDFKEAFRESDYRFDLDKLGLDTTLDDLSARVTDPMAKQKFEGMVGAIKNIVDNSKNGVGVEKDIDSLLDIRQMMNRFYRKNEKAFDLAPDKKTFRQMMGNIDGEIETALDMLGDDKVKKGLLNSFDSARNSYKEMYDQQNSLLYKSLMGEGKSSDDRVKALLKHATDDADEFQTLMQKMTPEESTKVEETLIDAVLKKNTKGKANEMQSIDYASVVAEFDKLKPFVKNEFTQKSMSLVEDMYKKYKHDFSLAKVVKGVTADSPSGGIATTAEGRMKAAGAKRLFDYVQTMIPFSDGAKRLALQRHIGKALERSRTPLALARSLAFDDAIPSTSRAELKELIKANNAVLRASNQEEQKKAMDVMNAKAQEISAKQEARTKMVEEFKTPTSEELRAVEILHADDKGSTMGRTIRAIQEGKANPADIERYVDAREAIPKNKRDKIIEKEKLRGLPAKYREVGDEQIKELEQLRDYTMSSDKIGFSELANPQQFKALIYDLKHTGHPRSLEYDEMYNSLRGAFEELRDDIRGAYGSVDDEPMDSFGNPLFGGVATVGALTGEADADDVLDKMVGLDDGMFDEKIVIEKFREIDDEIGRVRGDKRFSPTHRRETIKDLKEQKNILGEYLLDNKQNDKKSVGSKGSKTAFEVRHQERKDKKGLKDVIAHIESRGDYNAKNPNSSARGKYQFISSTLNYVSNETGLSKEYLTTPRGQEQAMDFLLKENERVLQNRKIPIDNFTMYGAHQLGASGFSRVYQGRPSKRDIANMKNNLPKKLRVGDVTQNWMNYYKRKVANA